MKKVLKKLSCALLAAAMVCAMTPLAASAAINYSKTRIVLYAHIRKGPGIR